MRKIVINRCYGGFGLSNAATALFRKYYVEEAGPAAMDNDPMEAERDDPILVRVVEELGNDANNSDSWLRIVEIPEDVQWHIDDYDGKETIREDHRMWY